MQQNTICFLIIEQNQFSLLFFNWFIPFFIHSCYWVHPACDASKTKPGKLKVQTANQESKIVKVMHQKGDGFKRHIFVDKMNAQQPVKISNLFVTASGTMFCNKGAGIQDLPSHTITFQYEVQDPFEMTMVNSLMKSNAYRYQWVYSAVYMGWAHYCCQRRELLHIHRM